MSTGAYGSAIESPLARLLPRESGLLRALGVTGISVRWRLGYMTGPPESVVLHLEARLPLPGTAALMSWAEGFFELKSTKVTFQYPPEPEGKPATDGSTPA